MQKENQHHHIQRNNFRFSWFGRRKRRSVESQLGGNLGARFCSNSSSTLCKVLIMMVTVVTICKTWAFSNLMFLTIQRKTIWSSTAVVNCAHLNGVPWSRKLWGENIPTKRPLKMFQRFSNIYTKQKVAFYIRLQFRFPSWAALETSQSWAKLFNPSSPRAIMTGAIVWWFLKFNFNFRIYRFSNMDCSKLKCGLQTSPNGLWLLRLFSHIVPRSAPKTQKSYFVWFL